MDLTDNPIANMYGPDFLLLYGVVSAMTLVVCWLRLRSRAGSSSGMPRYGDDLQALVNFVRRTKRGGALVIAGLGGYKLVVALSKGHYNVLFLIVMHRVACCAVCDASAGPSKGWGVKLIRPTTATTTRYRRR